MSKPRGLDRPIDVTPDVMVVNLGVDEHRSPAHEEPTMPGTVKLHRVLAAPPERVYKAFVDSDAKARWLPPYGFVGAVQQNDVKVGGQYRMSFTNFSSGSTHSFGGTYVELVPNQKIRYDDKFDDPNLPGTMSVTVQIKKVSVGTELHVEQSGIPDAIPAEACYLGWQESLEQLKRLVEPTIPD
jgi:uncharacterized protein YndB with AHSA1/START domain